MIWLHGWELVHEVLLGRHYEVGMGQTQCVDDEDNESVHCADSVDSVPILVSRLSRRRRYVSSTRTNRDGRVHNLGPSCLEIRHPVLHRPVRLPLFP